MTEVTADATPTVPRLEITDLDVSYGDARALFGVSLAIQPGGVLAVLGANGAGKSSLAAAIAGVVPSGSGRIAIDGVDVSALPSHRRAKLGLAYVPEGRGIFPRLSVVDNLRVLIHRATRPDDRSAALERAFASFPALADRRHQLAGSLSGGEQQMLALARVLAAPPRLLVVDELSLGLAPRVLDSVFAALDAARRAGVTLLVVEQYVDRALALADDVLLLRHGAVAWCVPTADARSRLTAGYLDQA